jgi:hypothetical protein
MRLSLLFSLKMIHSRYERFLVGEEQFGRVWRPLLHYGIRHIDTELKCVVRLPKVVGVSLFSGHIDEKRYIITLTITNRATNASASLPRPFKAPASLFLVLVGFAVLVAVGDAVNWTEYCAAIAELFTSQGAITHSEVRVLSVHFPFEALEGVMERT